VTRLHPHAKVMITEVEPSRQIVLARHSVVMLGTKGPLVRFVEVSILVSKGYCL